MANHFVCSAERFKLPCAVRAASTQAFSGRQRARLPKMRGHSAVETHVAYTDDPDKCL